MYRSRRIPLTLLEIMIVLVILGLVTAVVGINVRATVLRQRFLTETELVADRLRLAQDMMLLLGADVHVKMTEEERQLVLYLESESALSPVWERAMRNSRLSLREIHSVSFIDQNNPLGGQGGLDLLFLSNGSVMSKGEMLLSTHENPLAETALTRAICFFGAPHSFEVRTRDAQDRFCPELEDTFESLTSDTIRQVGRP